MLTNLWSRYHY